METVELQKALSEILASPTIRQKDALLLRLKAKLERDEQLKPYKVYAEEK